MVSGGRSSVGPLASISDETKMHALSKRAFKLRKRNPKLSTYMIIQPNLEFSKAVFNLLLKRKGDRIRR